MFQLSGIRYRLRVEDQGVDSRGLGFKLFDKGRRSMWDSGFVASLGFQKSRLKFSSRPKDDK